MASETQFEDFEFVDYASEDAPGALLTLFRLIYECRWLKKEQLQMCQQGTDHANEACTRFDKVMLEQAHELHLACNAPGRKTYSESRWRTELSPLVFDTFHIEEKRRFQGSQSFCSVCQVEFAPDTRPILNAARRYAEDTKRRSISSSSTSSNPRFADNDHCDQHCNVPHLSLEHDLQFRSCQVGTPRKRTKKGKIPDVTIGLAAYELKAKPWNSRPDLIQDPLVSSFDKPVLIDALKDIVSPYDFETNNTTPVLAFSIWEIKKADQSLLKATQQPSDKLIDLLEWQKTVFAKAGFEDLVPTVWSFSSVGSEWCLHGCFRRRERPYRVKLWSGDAADPHYAAQLIYIVHIIQAWAEHWYKTTMAVCLQRLVSDSTGQEARPTRDQLSDKIIEINGETCPFWFCRPGFTIPKPKSAHPPSRRLSAPVLAMPRTPERPPIPRMANTDDGVRRQPSSRRAPSRQGANADNQASPSTYHTTEEHLRSSMSNLDFVTDKKKNSSRKQNAQQASSSPASTRSAQGGRANTRLEGIETSKTTQTIITRSQRRSLVTQQ